MGRRYGGGDYSVAGNGRIAFTLADSYHPAELAISDSGGKHQKLTGLSDSWSAFRNLGEVREISYRSSVGKREIQGWLVLPPG